MTSMTEIEEQTRAYSNARAILKGRVQAMQRQVDQVRDQFINEIRAAVQQVADAHGVLKSTLDDAAELFEKPKTRTFSGVKVGYVKQRGKVDIADEAKTIDRIRKQLPEEQAELLIRSKESVHKPSVYDLTAADLKRLGISITDDEEIPVIKPVDTEVDKLVDALLAEIEQEEAA